MPIYGYRHLPPRLQDVVDRIQARGCVYGFELELLASFVSQ